MALCMVFAAPWGHAAGPVMPHEYLETARQHDCQPVAGFYDRPGMVEPMNVQYLHDVSTSSGEFSVGEDAAVFWCQDDADPELYRLLIHVRDCNRYSCGGRPRHHPVPLQSLWDDRGGSGGLELGTLFPVLRYFHAFPCSRQVTESRNYPGGLSVFEDTTWSSYPLIRSEYDGVEEIYYCWEGEWQRRFLH